jgi:sphingosine-1-phosphate phosphatase 1
MHSLTDVIAGICLGVVILAFWLVVDDHVDAFVVSGQNGMPQRQFGSGDR